MVERGWRMKNTIRLTDYKKEEIFKIFKIADELQTTDKYKDFLKGKTAVMFFPNNSIRTRISFEKGINLLGGQTILFPPETLNKKEEIKDVVGYLNNWADVAIIRHKNIELLYEISSYSKFPVVNAMTTANHPCEILTDLYSLSKIREDFLKDNYLFVGENANIGLAWKEASELMGIKLTQSCPKGYEIKGINVIYDLKEAIKNIDIVCTDPFPSSEKENFKNHQITKQIMELANENAILNPCPPFYRGNEVSEDVIDSEYFVGYEFKKHLLEVQQAIIIYNLTN